MQYRRADKSLARPGRKQARKHVRDASDFNNIEKGAVIKFLFLQGKAPKEIHAILTETLACFFPGRAKNLSVPLYQTLTLYLIKWGLFLGSSCRNKQFLSFCPLDDPRRSRYYALDLCETNHFWFTNHTFYVCTSQDRKKNLDTVI